MLYPRVAPIVGEDDEWETPGSSHVVAEPQDVQREKPDDIVDVDDEFGVSAR